MINEKIRFELSCACATYANEIAKIHEKYGGNADELFIAGIHALTEAHATGEVDLNTPLPTFALELMLEGGIKVWTKSDLM